MTPQEKAVTKAMRRHHRVGGFRDMLVHCACGWKSQDVKPGTSRAITRDAQCKSFERHATKQILEAVGTSPAPDDGRLFDLNVAVTGSQGKANVTIAVSGTDSIAVACLALQTVGQPEYVQAIYNGYRDDEDWNEDAAV